MNLYSIKASIKVNKLAPKVQAFLYDINLSLCFWSKVIETIIDIVEIWTAAHPKLNNAGKIV